MTIAENVPDETGRLMRAIGALSSERETMDRHGRMLCSGTSKDGSVLDAILSEVNETILRRELTFSKNDNEAVTLDVMERRILRLCKISRNDLESNVDQKLLEQPLTSEDAGKLYNLLRRFTADTSQLWVTSNLPGKNLDGSIDGIFCHELAQQAQNQSAPASASEPVLGAINRSKRTALAGLCCSNAETLSSWGDPDQFSLLENLTSTATVSSQENAVRLWYFDQNAILFAHTDGLNVWLLMSEQNAQANYQTWHDALFLNA